MALADGHDNTFRLHFPIEINPFRFIYISFRFTRSDFPIMFIHRCNPPPKREYSTATSIPASRHPGIPASRHLNPKIITTIMAMILITIQAGREGGGGQQREREKERKRERLACK